MSCRLRARGSLHAAAVQAEAELSNDHTDDMIPLAAVAARISTPVTQIEVLVVQDGAKITVAYLQGTIILIDHTRPATGVNYVGNGRSRG